MKKLFAALFALSVLCANVFAYDPPAGGQNVLRLTSPELITSANSSAGGGIFGVTPDSIINNPALTAWEQRITLVLLLVNIMLNMMPRSKLQTRFNEYIIAISLLKQGIYRKKYSF